MRIIITGYPIIKLTFLSPIFTFESYHQYEYISDIWSDIFLHRRNQRIRFSLLAGFYCVSTWFNAKKPRNIGFSVFIGFYFDIIRFSILDLLNMPVFTAFWFEKVWKTDFSRTSGFYVGIDFITIEISVLSLLSMPVLIVFWFL